MKTFSKPISALVVLAAAALAHADILFDQMTDPGQTLIPSSWFPPDGSDYDMYAWDNFLLPSDATINEVWWVGGGGSPTGFTVRFYTGLAAAPDLQPTITALPESETSANYLRGYRFTGNGNQTPIGGSSFYQYHVTLPTALSLPGNTVYWVKIEADIPGLPFWGVAMATHGRDAHHFNYSTGGHMFHSGSGSEAFQLRGTFVTAPVAGRVELQDFVGSALGRTCTITLTQNGQIVDSQTTTLGADGSYVIQTAIRGTVSVQTKSSHWLNRTSPSLNLTSAGLSAVDFSLLNGDCNEDNEVSIGDYSLLSAAYGSFPGDANWNSNTDLNGDDAVDIGDYSILSRNYGQLGD